MPYRKIGHQKKTAILYIQYIQYRGVCGPLDAAATPYIVGTVNTQKGGAKTAGIAWGTVIDTLGNCNRHTGNEPVKGSKERRLPSDSLAA